MASPEKDVGPKIRALRKKRKLTLNELSRMTGIAASNLSSIELNKTSPTLNTLAKIAHAFGMKAGEFLDEVLYSRAILCRKGEGKIVPTSSSGHSVRVLTEEVYQNAIECTTVALEASSEPLLSPGGQSHRFVFCTDGKLSARVDGEDMELTAGDGIYLLPDVGVIFENRSVEQASLLLVSCL